MMTDEELGAVAAGVVERLRPLVADAVAAAVGRAMEDELLTADEVAGLLKSSRRTVDRLASTGEIPPGRLVGGMRRWSRRGLARFIEALGEAAEAERELLASTNGGG